MKEKIKILVVEPQKVPREAEIYAELHEMQKVVDGYIEQLCPFHDSVAMFCDEEGKIKGKPLNRVLRDESGAVYDIVCGTFFLAGISNGKCISLSDVQLNQYKARFRTPEFFVNTQNGIMVMQMEEERAT